MTHGDRGDAHPFGAVRLEHLAHDDLPGGPRLADEGALSPGEDLADPVRPIHRLTSRGSDLAEDEPPVAGGFGRQEQEVGEAEVGEHPPLGDKALEVGDLHASERRLVPCELGEGRHRSRCYEPGVGERS